MVRGYQPRILLSGYGPPIELVSAIQVEGFGGSQIFETTNEVCFAAAGCKCDGDIAVVVLREVGVVHMLV